MSAPFKVGRIKPVGEFLNRFADPDAKSEVIQIPGMRSGPDGFIRFVLDVLNGRDEQRLGDYLGFHLTADWGIRTAEFLKFLGALWDHPDFFYGGVEDFAETLRRMADLWIDSGKSAQNPKADSPAERNVEDELPGQPISLFVWIDRLVFDVHLSYTGMRRDGTVGIKQGFPRFDLSSLSWGRWDEAMKRYACMMAAYNFVNLLNSPYSRRLSRCDSCKSYFVYARTRLRTVKNGVYCQKCAGSASVARTIASRDKRRDTAANAWIEWESRRKGSPEFEWIANRVNKSHGTAFGRRWVSQNLKEIQERVEALRNAKG